MKTLTPKQNQLNNDSYKQHLHIKNTKKGFVTFLVLLFFVSYISTNLAGAQSIQPTQATTYATQPAAEMSNFNAFTLNATTTNLIEIDSVLNSVVSNKSTVLGCLIGYNFSPLTGTPCFSTTAATTSTSTVATTSTTTLAEIINTNKTSLSSSSPDNINEINAPDIVAKNAAVYDITNRRFVYAKNASEPVPMASLVKIITSTVFLQLNSARKKIGNSIETIKILKSGKGYNQGDRDLIDGEYWKVENLIRYMLITSSNYAAQSLVKSMIDDEFAFSLLMNKTVKDLGFKTFDFKNSSGLSIPNPNYNSKILNSQKEIPSAIGSAKEIAILFDSIFTNIPFLGSASVIPEATFINWSGNTHTTKNVNYSIFEIPNIIAGKTGTTEESGGNLIIVTNPNKQKYAIVILGSTIQDRYNDAVKLASSTEAFATLK